MSDVDPLAHLYAETGAGELEFDELDLEAVRRETSLEELEAVDDGDGDEEISDSDLDELARLVRARLDEDGARLDDEEAVELGLGTIVDGDLELNSTGLAVARRLLDWHVAESLNTGRTEL